MTKIEWTEFSLNPWRGCSPVSAGCTHCYAEKVAAQFAQKGDHRYGYVVNERGKWNGKFVACFEQLQKPLSRHKDSVYFMASMTDFCHPAAPDFWRDNAMAIISVCSGRYRNHTFQILTKHPNNMERYFDFLGGLSERDRYHLFRESLEVLVQTEEIKFPKWARIPGIIDATWPLSNVWLGTTVENQKACDRIQVLKTIPAKVHFLSCEPLLEPIDLGDLSGIQWVICGGESGDKARFCDPRWLGSIVQQCKAQNVPCFVKQLGNNVKQFRDFPVELQVREFPMMA